MKALLTLQLCGLAVLSLLTSACNLLPLSPSLSLTIQSAPYTSSTVNIPYEFQTLSRNSDGSARCSYTLSKFDSIVGGYAQVGSNMDTTLQSKGTLSFPLTTMLGTTAGSSTVDGLYALTFSVLSDTYDQNGNRIPFPFLTQTAHFTVYTITGPEIFSASPPIINPNYSQTATLTGTGFTTGGTLTTSPSITTGYTYGDAGHISAGLNAATLTPGGTVGIQFQDGKGNTSPSYFLPVVGQATVTSVSPSSGSNQDTALSLTVTGSYLGYWTTVTITDAAGHAATMHIQQVSGPLGGTINLYGHMDLTTLTTPGPATLTVSNPDGSPPATASFTVTN